MLPSTSLLRIVLYPFDKVALHIHVAKQKEDVMKVILKHKETGKTHGPYEIFLSGIGYTPTNNEHFDLAWSNAVDDSEVDETERDQYEFIITSEA